MEQALNIKMKNIVALLVLLLSIYSSSQNFTPQVEEVNGIIVRDTVLDFTAIDKDSIRYSLAADLEEGPVVVIFIRGEWCGYCNRHLSNLQDSLSQITAKGARVVIVSPEKPEHLYTTVSKTDIEATLLYDSGYVIMNQFDVLWAPKDKDLAKYQKYFGEAMKQSHSDDSQRLPVPATYIVGTDGVIRWRHFDRDYSKRSTVEDILENL
jgi:peroxiredoxin